MMQLNACYVMDAGEPYGYGDLHHDGAQIVAGFEDGQDAFDNADQAGDKRPAENQIQQAHPKTPSTEFVYAKRTKQQGHGDVQGFVTGVWVLGGVRIKRVQEGNLRQWICLINSVTGRYFKRLNQI